MQSQSQLSCDDCGQQWSFWGGLMRSRNYVVSTNNSNRNGNNDEQGIEQHHDTLVPLA